MIIGVPKEIKDHEYRVAITPGGVEILLGRGHRVIIEAFAGTGSGYPDETYARCGAEIVERKEVFSNSDIIVKIKEPQPEEYDLFGSEQVLFTFFHFAANRKLTDAMAARGTTCIAYETVQTDDGSLPLLAPMSDVAGRVAMSAAIRYLERPMGGKGKLISGVPGVRPGTVMILGGGIAGTSAAKISEGLGAEVYVFDTNLQRLRFLFDTCGANVHPLASNPYTIREILPMADVLIGTVLVPGGRTPILVSEEMLKTMESGSVVIDVSIDQGGCIATTRPTTHSQPTFVHDGIVHYGVTNMPGAVPYTSTRALTNATLPYLCELADKGWVQAVAENSALRKGVNLSGGKIYCPGVAAAFGIEPTPLDFA